MNPAARDKFVLDLTGQQQAIYAYICAQLVDRTAVDDVFQSTNLAVWRRFDEGEAIRDVRAFAFTVARYEVLAYLKRQQRERLRFDDGLLELVAEESSEQAALIDEQRHALARCLRELPEHSRRLVEERYGPKGSVKSVAARLGRSVASVSQALYRIRNLLSECLEAASASEADR